MKQDSIRAGIITLVVAICLLGFVAMVKGTDTPKCMEAGCDNEPASGSSYCYLHKPYPSTIWGSTRDSGYSSTSGSTGSSASSSTSRGTGSSTSSITASKSTVTNRNATSSKTSKKSSTSSYDEGYDDVYENEDYDMDRYYEDDDYASGVDDAMEDEDW